MSEGNLCTTWLKVDSTRYCSEFQQIIVKSNDNYIINRINFINERVWVFCEVPAEHVYYSYRLRLLKDQTLSAWSKMENGRE